MTPIDRNISSGPWAATQEADENGGAPIGAGDHGFDPRAGVSRADWLSTPTQRLAEFTGGGVFHDGLNVLHPARAALRWFV